MTEPNADPTEEDDQHDAGLDPGLMALLFVVQVAFLAWVGPDLWHAFATGGSESVWSWRPSFPTFSVEVGELFADPDEHGVGAYAANWLVTLWLFMTLLAVIWMPMKFRQSVNDLVGGEASD